MIETIIFQFIVLLSFLYFFGKYRKKFQLSVFHSIMNIESRFEKYELEKEKFIDNFQKKKDMLINIAEGRECTLEKELEKLRKRNQEIKIEIIKLKSQLRKKKYR